MPLTGRRLRGSPRGGRAGPPRGRSGPRRSGPPRSPASIPGRRWDVPPSSRRVRDPEGDVLRLLVLLDPDAAVAGLLVALRRLLEDAGREPLVDVDLAGLETPRHAPGAIEVAGEDPGPHALPRRLFD